MPPPAMAAAALGAAIASSTAEIASMVDGSDFSRLNHQGARHGIFLATCENPQGRLLVLAVYDRESSLGLVQLFFDGLVTDLAVHAPEHEPRRAVLAADFERDLNESLAALFQA